MAAPEEELKKLSKLPDNKQCANCDNISQAKHHDCRFGHGNVCMPFKIFVCSNCKSAFQAYSYRVKSITMSNFTKEEVDAFRGRNGGGNEAARRTFQGLLSADDPRRPRAGDPIEKYKTFVQQVYGDRLFYANEAPSRSTVAPEAPAGYSFTAPTTPASPPRADITNVKGRWGPSTPAKDSVDALGRRVDAGWGSQVMESPSDGIKIRTEPPTTASNSSHSHADEFDLLGFSASSTVPTAGSASGGLADDLFGFSTGAGATPQTSFTAGQTPQTTATTTSAVPLSAAIMSAYGQRGGAPGGMPGAAISAAFQPFPSPYAAMQSQTSHVMMAPSNNISAMMGPPGAIPGMMMTPGGPMGGAPAPTMGLNALNFGESTRQASNGSLTSHASHATQSSGASTGLDGLLAGLGIGEGKADFSMRATSAPVASPETGTPLARALSTGSSPSVGPGTPVMSKPVMSGGLNPGAAAISSLGGYSGPAAMPMPYAAMPPIARPPMPGYGAPGAFPGGMMGMGGTPTPTAVGIPPVAPSMMMGMPPAPVPAASRGPSFDPFFGI